MILFGNQCASPPPQRNKIIKLESIVLRTLWNGGFQCNNLVT